MGHKERTEKNRYINTGSFQFFPPFFLQNLTEVSVLNVMSFIFYHLRITALVPFKKKKKKSSVRVFNTVRNILNGLFNI